MDMIDGFWLWSGVMAFVALFAWLAWRGWVKRPEEELEAAPDIVVCERCRTAGKPAMFDPGDGLTETLLWICALLPGVVYSMWRRNSRKRICAACQSAEVVPLMSPRGQEITR